MAENFAGHNAGNVSFTEKESAGTQEVLRQKFQWGSKPCLNVATVRPLPRSQDRPQSPVLTSPVSSTRLPDDVSSPQNRPSSVARRNITLLCPFSFDLRDSMQRVAREQKLERLRMIEERQQAMAVSFRASGVRKYKPLVLNVNARRPAHPRSPVSRNDP